MGTAQVSETKKRQKTTIFISPDLFGFFFLLKNQKKKNYDFLTNMLYENYFSLKFKFIPLCRRYVENKLFWAHFQSEVYTVKSGYKFLAKNQAAVGQSTPVVENLDKSLGYGYPK